MATLPLTSILVNLSRERDTVEPSHDGLVSRERNRENRRELFIHLTGARRALLAAGRPHH
ncbi:hypothetical protein AB0G04_08120 [Actinoplanes sp. NPDC023801]|uniref:hypothetical protein n=1 Tax=Actinoplanes sp. NPDC023801 TaxID=3154595 RepID=UPI0033C3F08C